jgi:DNA-binding MarR family transcriptional regulator
MTVIDNEGEEECTENSVSGRSAALFFENDPSLATLLSSHGIRVRDFIMLSFLADQGPMSVAQLSRAVGIEADILSTGMRRLSAAGLITRASNGHEADSLVELTPRGEDVSRRINNQL